MTITPLKVEIPSPRQDLTTKITMLLNGAIASDEPIGVNDLAEMIVSSTEPSDDALNRLYRFVSEITYRELCAANRLTFDQFEELETTSWADDIACVVRAEVARGAASWRNDVSSEERADFEKGWRHLLV